MSAQVRSSSGFITSGASSANVVIPVPSGCQKGDYLVAVLQSDNTSAGKFSSSGWSDPPSGTIDWNLSVDSGRFTILVRRADGTETSSYTFASSSAIGCCGVMVCFKGVDDTAVDAASGSYTSTNYSSGSVTLTAASITTTKDNDILLYFGATDSTDNTTTITPGTPSGFTDQGNGQDTSGWNALSVATKALGSAGVVGTTSATFTQGAITSAVGISKGQLAFIPVVWEQYAFRFGVDDANEASHTFAQTENTNYSAALSTQFLIRMGINCTNDPPDIIYKLKYQKNGSGGYVDVPVGAMATYGIPTFKSTGTGASGTGAVTVGMPSSFAAGDLLVMAVETANESVASPPSGWTQDASSPQGTGTAAGTAATRLTLYYKIATGSETSINIGDAGDHTFARTFAISGVHQTTPVHQTNGAVASTASTSVSCPSVTTTVNNCLILNIYTNGTDTTTTQSSAQSNGNLSSLTEQIDQNVTAGNGGGITVLSGGLATAGSTGNTTATLATSSVQGKITLAIQPPVSTTNEIYISPSSNIASSGEATTARLTAPSGKSSGTDFTTGRRWDDENGTDSLNFGSDKYSELEWCINTQSPAASADFYDFKVYVGNDAIDTYTNVPRYTVGSPSGSVSVSATSSVTATERKNAGASVSISASSAVSSSEGKIAQGTASINTSAAVTATETAAHNGTASVTGAAVPTVTYTAAHNGSTTISAGASVSAAAEDSKSGTASVSATTSVSSTGVKGALAAINCTATSDVSATGQQDSTSASGSATASATTSVSTTGEKAATSSPSISATSSVSSTGAKTAAGTASVSTTSSVFATGIHGDTGTATASATSSITATGQKTASGTVSVSNSSSVTVTGQKGANSAASISHTCDATATGSSAIVVPVSTAVSITGEKTASGAANASVTTSVSANGLRLGVGSATISATTATSATGNKGAIGTASVSAVATPSVTGNKSTTGTVTISTTSSVSSTGQQSGTTVIVDVSSAVSATGRKTALNTVTIGSAVSLDIVTTTSRQGTASVAVSVDIVAAAIVGHLPDVTEIIEAGVVFDVVIEGQAVFSIPVSGSAIFALIETGTAEVI